MTKKILLYIILTHDHTVLMNMINKLTVVYNTTCGNSDINCISEFGVVGGSNGTVCYDKYVISKHLISSRCMHTYMIIMYIHEYIHLHTLHTYTHTYIHTCTYTHIHTHTYLHTNIHVYTYIHT